MTIFWNRKIFSFCKKVKLSQYFFRYSSLYVCLRRNKSEDARKRVFDFEEAIPLRIRIGFDQRVWTVVLSRHPSSDAPCFYSAASLFFISRSLFWGKRRKQWHAYVENPRDSRYVFYVWVIWHKSALRERKRKREKEGWGGKGKEKEDGRRCSHPTSERRFRGAFNRCESSSRERTRCCIFRRAGRGFKQRYATRVEKRNETRGASNAKTRKSEVRLPGNHSSFPPSFFFNIYNFYVNSLLEVYIWRKVNPLLPYYRIHYLSIIFLSF